MVAIPDKIMTILSRIIVILNKIIAILSKIKAISYQITAILSKIVTIPHAMTKYQDSILRMTKAIRLVLDKYQSIWSTHAEFSAAANALINATMEQVYPLVGQQGTKTTALTESKKQDRAAIVVDLAHMASCIALYAKTAGNAQLKAEAHLMPSRIKAATDDALVGMVLRITRLATQHLPALTPFGITAADVSALSAKGDAYEPLIGAPARLRQTVTEATANLAALISGMRANLATMDDYMIMWSRTEPEFYAAYFEARRIVKPGFRARALEIAVQNAEGAPVAGAVFTMPHERIKKKTSARGVCRISHLPEGTHKAQVSAEGFAPKEIAVQVVGNEGQKLKVVMEKG
jgi:hypothetical protein